MLIFSYVVDLVTMDIILMAEIILSVFLTIMDESTLKSLD